MAEYQDDLALIVRYDGTKAAFDNVRSNYKNKVVFIYGSEDAVENQAGLVQAIWVGDSTGGRYLDMANVGAIKDGLTHIAGFAIDGAMPEFSGGANGINFKGAGDITISLKPANATDNEGVPYWTIEVDGGTLKSAIETAQAAAKAADDKAAGVSNTVNGLIGTSASDRGKTIREIAAEEAEAVGSVLLGELGDDYEDDTIRGVKNTVGTTNMFLFNSAVPVEGDKINASVLPDVIMGQLKFGGTIGNTKSTIQNQELQITPSKDLDDAFTNITTKPFAFTPTKDNADDYKGWYFIVAKPAVEGSIGNFELEVTVDLAALKEFYEVGDWLLSTGLDWVKIDNTDAVVRVAGMQGDITTEELVRQLSTKDAQTNPDPLAKESSITVKGVKADDDSKEYITVTTDAATKEATISVETASMQDVIGEFIQGNDALATANDVFNFIKARLSIKVVK